MRMIHRHILPVALALAVGFLVGRGTSEPSIGKTSPGSNPAKQDLRSASNSPFQENSQRPSRSQVRDEKSPSENTGRKISLSRDLVVKDLKERQLSHMSFDHIDLNIDGPLKLLGATEGERENVKKTLVKAKEAILAAEKKELKIIRSDSTGVDLDVSGMKNVLPAILAATQEDLRTTLPADLADMLNQSINWEGFYDISKEFAPAKLYIAKESQGKVIAWGMFAGGGHGNHVSGNKLPAEGELFQADQYFGDRWKPFLKGVMLEAIDPP